MSFSFTQYSGNGTKREFAIPFPYVSREHIIVALNNVDVPASSFTFLDSGTIQFTTAPASGVSVLIRRSTPVDEKLFTFSDASALPARDINAVFDQLLFIFQEGLEERVFEVGVGPAGPQGPAGPAGPVGATGPAGPPGSSAAQSTNYGSLT